MIDALKVSNAAKQIGRIPVKNETLHCIMSGNYDGFDIVNGILTLIDPATIREKNAAKAIPPLYGALLKNEQDVQLFEKLAFMARRQN